MFDNASAAHVIDMLRDRFQMALHKYYFHLHVVVAVAWLLIDPTLFVSAYLAPIALLWEFGSLVNSLNHLYGYKNRPSDKHTAYNNPITGYLFFGEGWHANHHDFPLRSTNKERWWEFDLAGTMIKLLGK
jgi:stearoyl-CoA desaturase (delta-9 desaturase)